MELNYQLTRKALLQGSWLQTSFVQMSAYSFGGMLVLYALSRAASWPQHASLIQIGRWMLPSVEFAAGMTVFAVAFTAVVLPLRVWQVHRQNTVLYGHTRLVANGEGIEVIGPRNVVKLSWSDLRGFRENANVFLISVSKSVGLSIPKVDLSDCEIEEFSGILRGKLKRL